MIFSSYLCNFFEKNKNHSKEKRSFDVLYMARKELSVTTKTAA